MRFIDALKTLQGQPLDGEPLRICLACGFTPLHLQTFLGAYVREAMPQRSIELANGLYGNLVGTVEAATDPGNDALVVALEWFDLDPRLGYRIAGAWGPDATADIVATANASLDRLGLALDGVPRSSASVVLSMPTLPLPPLFHTAGWQTADAEAALEEMIATFRSRALAAGHAVVSSQRLAELSPLATRHDLKADLLSGAPYTLPHANALGMLLAQGVVLRPPKKGLITDLDDTLWSGLVGEVGPEAVTWDLESHTALHGLFQRLLASLAQEGVLVAIASKNDGAIVQQALRRPDLLIRPEQVHPVEAHWEAKSGSVDRILRAWNIGADSVVFVDDSAIELAEVAAAHPGIETIQFPTRDYSAGRAMLQRIRDLFGKPRISDEDRIRVASIRTAEAFTREGRESAPDAFLAGLGATISLSFEQPGDDPRALELINKTNQFNLNGIRHTESDWARPPMGADPLLVVASYTDKFGPLGKIAVLRGRRQGATLRIDAWVMSCRAFARRIEYQCLRACFDDRSVDCIEFEFLRTEKNGPLRELLRTLTGHEPDGTVTVTRQQFAAACPALYHTVLRTRSVPADG